MPSRRSGDHARVVGQALTTHRVLVLVMLVGAPYALGQGGAGALVLVLVACAFVGGIGEAEHRYPC